MNEARARAPRAVPAAALPALLAGFAYPFEALGFIRRHRLWGLCAAAIGVNVALFVVMVTLAVYVVVPWVQHLLAGFSSDVARAVLTVLAWLVVLALSLAVASVVLLLVGQALASPFLDVLSERVEKLVTGREGPKLGVRTVLRSVRVALGDLVWGLLYYVAVNVPLFLLGLVPVIGTIPAGAASVVFTALLLSQEFVGLPLTRQHVPYRGRWRFVLSHRASALGFGLAAMAMLVLPGLNLVLLPVATVGGTLLYCDLSAAQLSASASSSQGAPRLPA